MATEEKDEGWMRYPEAKVRLPENGLKPLLDGLTEDGFCVGAIPRIHLLDDGIYVDILLNSGKHGSVIALPFEIFIPVPPKQLEKFTKKSKPKKKLKTNEPMPDAVLVEPIVELRNDELVPAEGPDLLP